MVSRAQDVVGFAERVLALLDQGAFSSTYKFAVFVGLLDLCCEGADKNGDPPEVVTTTQLAEAVVRIYWRQTSPYLDTGAALSQNAGAEAKILRLIREFRDAAAPPLSWFAAQRQASFARLLREVEWVLVEMPLPKLQRFGSQEQRFLYEIAWDDGISRARWRDPLHFDNRIRFAPGAARNLALLASLLRPLILERWARMVAQLNRLPESELHDFLFESDRRALSRLRAPLIELQEGHCFYCAGKLTVSRTHVDHFIPWSRHPDDGLDNLVAADERCNGDKRDFLPGHIHVERWARRCGAHDRQLEAIAREHDWLRHRDRTIGLVRSSLLGVHSSLQLWHGRNSFELADPARLRSVLVSL
ncbi:MAG: hypothetical protein FJ294_13390 [Planctomycetes bacterium]|nr:hypothetical protein [Planctomycetota bacterium]MBM3988938.1 hypothetical protein [Planctomycetota bacterium]